MKTPHFKKSKRFLGDLKLPCRVTTLKNSKLPGIAARYIASAKNDPLCEIYLRGGSDPGTSKWEEDILDRLLVKEGYLANAIETAMKQYAKSPDAFADANRKEREGIERLGIAPFIALQMIVIDESEQEVILKARMECDGHLIEHGISIYLKGERWRFDYGDYLIRYSERLGADDDSEDREHVLKKLDGLFADKKMDNLAGGGVEIAYGKWEFEGGETKTNLQKVGYPARRIADTLDFGAKGVLEITSEEIRYLRYGTIPFWNERIIHIAQAKDKIIIRSQAPAGSPSERVFRCNGRHLTDSEGVVYQRI
jgi:hypothetical protein